MKYNGIASVSFEIEPDLSVLRSLYAKFKLIIFGIRGNPKCYWYIGKKKRTERTINPSTANVPSMQNPVKWSA